MQIEHFFGTETRPSNGDIWDEFNKQHLKKHHTSPFYKNKVQIKFAFSFGPSDAFVFKG